MQAATSELAAAAHSSSDLLRGSQDAAAAVHEVAALRKRNHDLQQALAEQFLSQDKENAATDDRAHEVRPASCTSQSAGQSVDGAMLPLGRRVSLKVTGRTISQVSSCEAIYAHLARC